MALQLRGNSEEAAGGSTVSARGLQMLAAATSERELQVMTAAMSERELQVLAVAAGLEELVGREWESAWRTNKQTKKMQIKRKHERKGVSAVIGVKMQLQQKCLQRLAVRASAGELADEGGGRAAGGSSGAEELW